MSNLVPQLVNPRFDLVGIPTPGLPASLTGWSVADGELRQDTARTHSGDVSGKWQAGTRSGFAATFPTLPDFAVGRLWGTFAEGSGVFRPAVLYTLTGWVLADSACTASMRLGYVPNGVLADTAAIVTPVALTPLVWTPLSVAWRPQKEYEGPQVGVNVWLPTQGNVKAVWLDDFAVVGS